MVHFSENEYEYYKSEVSKYETVKSDLLDKYFYLWKRTAIIETKRENGIYYST